VPSSDPSTVESESRADREGGYGLEELSRASGVPARTIRFYRQSGLIEPPRRVGRFAFYDADQLARLRLIAALRSRGLGLDGVAKVLRDPAGEHRPLATLLEIRGELLQPWIDDRSDTLTGSELLELVGSLHLDTISELIQYGLITAVGDRYEIPSVTTLELAAELRRAGVEADVAALAWGTMQLHTAALADALVRIFVDREDYGFSGASTLDEVTTGLRSLRDVALRAVQVAFAHEIERALEGYLADLAGGVDSP
jgi:DNA-binding transcriptional MerR regulator